MSLRSRLLIASTVLVTLGLLAAGATTYVLVRSSLVERIDRQLEGLRPLARGALLSEFGGPRPMRIGGGVTREGGTLPPSTLAALVDPDGSTLRWETLGFEHTGEVPPPLPKGLPGARGVAADERYLTAGSITGRYRALASSLGDGEGTLVVAISLDEVEATLRRLLLVEGAAAAAVLAGVVALALWLVRVGLRPLERIGVTAGAIAAGDLSQRVDIAEPRTEVGRLGIALNEMLERIETAFAEREASERRLRRFVADASHELRTPLTSIRGYAELFGLGADIDNPEDLDKAMRRIRQEAERMGMLVDELLLLARLDQGRPLEHEPVDLTRVVSDAVEDARAVDATRPIEWSPDGAVLVDGDDLRLRQLVANLLGNVRDHTPPGTNVRVCAFDAERDAVIEVSDSGPGMSHEQAEHAFDRFWRADPSRSRESGGAGLGLAIVHAVAAAHGGRVELDTSPGTGATFRVFLPKAQTHSELPAPPDLAPISPE